MVASYKTKWWSIVLMLFCTIFTSTGQIFYKFASARITEDFYSVLWNGPLLLGLASYGIGLILLLLAFRGGELSVLYPIIATSYIWVCIASPVFFNDDVMTPKKWVGIVFIVSGVCLVGIGSGKKAQ